MKRDSTKIKRVRECIKVFYLSVSDNAIAQKFGVSEASVKKARQRMGLKKPIDVAVSLRDKARA